MSIRLQPPLDGHRFVGKAADKDLIMEYIGSHQVLGEERKMSLDEFFKDNYFYIICNSERFISLFPNEIKDLAFLYWIYKQEIKSNGDI